MNSNTIRSAIFAFPVMALALPIIAVGDEMTAEEMQQGYIKHAALAQYYRWYQLYERPDGGMENALNILSEDITVKSGLGEAKGHQEYADRVSKLPATWQNAHHVKSVDVTVENTGEIALSAEITYQNLGINPDGKVRMADLTYTMSLTPSDTVLPKFSAISIAQNSEGEAASFDDAYARNRTLSLVHYWLALIEDPSRNPEPVREILSDKFILNFSSGAITDFEGFKAWLAGPASSVSASTHKMSNFSHQLLAEDEYALTMDFDWAGVLPNGDELIAKTRHNWTVSNSVVERFARIKSVDVEVLEAFRPKTQ